jgi:hypothetical protein
MEEKIKTYFNNNKTQQNYDEYFVNKSLFLQLCNALEEKFIVLVNAKCVVEIMDVNGFEFNIIDDNDDNDVKVTKFVINHDDEMAKKHELIMNELNNAKDTLNISEKDAEHLFNDKELSKNKNFNEIKELFNKIILELEQIKENAINKNNTLTYLLYRVNGWLINHSNMVITNITNFEKNILAHKDNISDVVENVENQRNDLKELYKKKINNEIENIKSSQTSNQQNALSGVNITNTMKTNLERLTSENDNYFNDSEINQTPISETKLNEMSSILKEYFLFDNYFLYYKNFLLSNNNFNNMVIEIKNLIKNFIDQNTENKYYVSSVTSMDNSVNRLNNDNKKYIDSQKSENFFKYKIIQFKYLLKSSLNSSLIKIFKGGDGDSVSDNNKLNNFILDINKEEQRNKLFFQESNFLQFCKEINTITNNEQNNIICLGTTKLLVKFSENVIEFYPYEVDTNNRVNIIKANMIKLTLGDNDIITIDPPPAVVVAPAVEGETPAVEEETPAVEEETPAGNGADKGGSSNKNKLQQKRLRQQTKKNNSNVKKSAKRNISY